MRPWFGLEPAKPKPPTANVLAISGVWFSTCSACFAMFIVYSSDAPCGACMRMMM